MPKLYHFADRIPGTLFKKPVLCSFPFYAQVLVCVRKLKHLVQSKKSYFLYATYLKDIDHFPNIKTPKAYLKTSGKAKKGKK